MKGNYIFAFCFFGFFFIVFFLAGILGTWFTVRYYSNVIALENSEIIKTATITNISRGRRSGNTIFFTTESNEKTYRANIMRISSGVGDDIEVRFNDDRTAFLIPQYLSAIRIGYIVQVILFIFCFVLSILILIGIIKGYRSM